MIKHYFLRLSGVLNRYDFLYPILLALPLVIRFGVLDLTALGSDTRTHIYKSYVLAEQIRQLPPNLWGSWDWNWFCGYPFLKLYSPMFYYVLAFFSTPLNIAPEAVAHVTIFLSYPLSAISMYFLAKNLTNNIWASLAGSSLYLYIPFHLANGTQFGNPSSLLTFVFMPLVFLFTEKFADVKKKRFMILACLSLVAVLLTNHAYAVAFTGLLLGWFLLRRKILPAVLVVSVTLLLSTFFIIPLLYYSSNANTFFPMQTKLNLSSIMLTFQPAGMLFGSALVIATVLLVISIVLLSKNRKNTEKHFALSRKEKKILYVSCVLLLLVLLYDLTLEFFPIWPFSALTSTRIIAPVLIVLSISVAFALLATGPKKKILSLIIIALFVTEGLFTSIYYPLASDRYEKAFRFVELDSEWFRVFFLPQEPVGSISPLYTKKPVADGWFVQGESPEFHSALSFLLSEFTKNPDRALTVLRYLGVKYVIVDTQDPVFGIHYSMTLYRAINSSSVAQEVFADKGVAVFKISGYKPLIAAKNVQLINKLEQAYVNMDGNSIFVVNGNAFAMQPFSETIGEVNLEVRSLEQDVGHFSVVFSLNRSSYVMVPVSYSPNLRVKINNEETVPIKLVPSFIGVQLPSDGIYQIEISVRTMPVDVFSSLISLIALAVLFFLLLMPRKDLSGPLNHASQLKLDQNVSNLTDVISTRKISVIIPTKNRRKHLKECLKSLFESSLTPEEVIVVDINSTDGTTEMVEQYPVTLLKVDEANRQRQRNIGLFKARGDIVVFLDDDIIIEKAALKHMVKAYCSDVGGVGGRVLPYGMPKEYFVPVSNNLVGKVRNDGVVIGNFDIPLEKSIEVDCLQGCFMSFRRKVLREAGGFDENYGSFFRGDDTDVSLSVKKKGYKMIYEPRAIVWHKGLGKSSYYSKQWVYFYVRGCTYFYFKHIFPVSKRFFPWFLKGLFFPPKDYAKKSGIILHLTGSLPLTVIQGIIDGMLPHLRKQIQKLRLF